MGRSKTWISGREDDGKRPIKSFGPNPKRQRKVAPVSQSKINLRDEIPEEERGLIEVRVEVKGRNENSCEEIEVGVEDKVRNEESCEEIEVEDERIEEEEKHEEEDEESYEIEEAAAANNGGKGESADTVKRSGNGSISVTLTDPELLDCPVCFDALTTPVFQEVAGFRRKQKMGRAKNTTTQGGGTSSSGVQFRDVQHKKQYKEMTKRDICLGRSLDLGFITSLGLGDEINGWIRNLKWEQLASIRYDGYTHLIYEFFSSLEVVERSTDDLPPYTMFFRLKNQNCVVRPQDLANWIGIDFEGLDNVPRTWDSKQAWTDVSGIGVYHPHRCKSTKLKNPAMRVFHRFLTFTFNGRKETNGNVTVKDLLLMEAAITGKQVNSAKLLIKKLREIKAEKGDIYWGMVVTLICQKLGFEITPSDKANKITFSTNNLLGDVTLSRMGLIKKNVSGEWLLMRDEIEEEATVQEGVPIPEGENEGRVYVRKRRRMSIEPESSQNVEETSSHTLDEIVSRIDRIERFQEESFSRIERRMQEQQDQLQSDFNSFASRIEETVDILGECMTEISNMMKKLASASSSSSQPPPSTLG